MFGVASMYTVHDISVPTVDKGILGIILSLVYGV